MKLQCHCLFCLLLLLLLDLTVHCILSFLLFPISCDGYFLVKALLPNAHLSLNNFSSKRNTYFSFHHPPFPSSCKTKNIQIWGTNQTGSLYTSAIPMNMGKRSKKFWQCSFSDFLTKIYKSMGHFQTIPWPDFFHLHIEVHFEYICIDKKHSIYTGKEIFKES